MNPEVFMFYLNIFALFVALVALYVAVMVRVNKITKKYKHGGEMFTRPLLDSWRCEICHKVRKDEDINTMSFSMKGLSGAIRNVKYCNDNPLCFEGAEKLYDEEQK